LKIGYIIGTYPLITTTFIDREIQAVRDHNIEVTVLSIRRPPPEVAQRPEYTTARSTTIYLLPPDWLKFLLAHLYYAAIAPATYWGLLGYLLTRPHPSARARLKTALHFAEAVYAAYRLRGEHCDHLHAHFADRAATVALCAARLLGIPYSLTAHANDLFAGPLLLSEKFKNARFAVTVSRFNKEYIQSKHPDVDGKQIAVLHPWVNMDEFNPPATRPTNRRFTILSVGRLVEKKGHRYLIQACGLLREQGLHVKCRIIGSGPLERELHALIAEQGLADCVTLEGPQPKAEVIRRLAEADVFVLASVIAEDGDRDGMPVALAEAMAMQVPVISTDIVGIGELVQPGAGYLVSSQDSTTLAHAIQTIYRMSREGRSEMGKWGRAIVESDFQVDKGIDNLVELFRQSLPAAPVRVRQPVHALPPSLSDLNPRASSQKERTS
jgi:colanic acid/amylovoran biosynthesis glycosyltransferase